jgi:hypothetical protein
MAFPEDTDFTAPSYRQSRGSIIAELSTLALFTLILQIGIGILVILYALPAFLATILLLPLLEDAIPTMSLWGYLIVWAILPIVGVLQLRAGYKLYKRRPNTVDGAKIVNIAAMLLLGIDTVISALEGSLLAYPEVAMYFTIAVVVFILLNMSSIRDELEPDDYQKPMQSFYG